MKLKPYCKVVLLLLLFLPSIMYGQAKQITGTVKLASGEPVANATVNQKGTTNTVIADENGKFSIAVTGRNVVLTISSAGYTTQDITVGTATEYDVVLAPNAGELDDVIVVAYGTSTKRSFTGSASVIKQDALKDMPTTSFENALTGRVAGLQVTQSSGQAGAVSTLRIRGIGSMNAGNDPLYVIDGVPVASGNAGQLGSQILTTNNIMNTLNPADIETITVLKDAAASSLYGSRAANGIVLITTKRGRSGKPVIGLRSTVSFTPSWATDNYEPAGVQEQVNMLYQVFHDLNTSAGSTDAAANTNALSRLSTRFNRHGYDFSTAGPGRYENVKITGRTDGIENRDGRYFNWEDALFGTGYYNTNDLSISGGNAGTTYYSSLSYTKDQSRIKENEFDRISGRVNLNQKVGKAVELMTNLNISKNRQSGFNDSRNTGGNVFFQSRNLLWPLYWPTDYKTGLPFTARYGSLAYNNEYYKNEWDTRSNTLNIGAVGGLTIHLLPSLRLKSVLSYNDNRVREMLYYSAKHFNAQSDTGSIREYLTAFTKTVSSTTLNYNESFGNHNIDVLVGYEAEQNKTDYMLSSGIKLPSSGLITVATAGQTSANAYSWGNNLVSYLSRLEYNYNQKYYASFSYRRDGSSRLAPETRWGNFWSVGASWNIDKEKFMSNIEAISSLRLRASYGINGTQPSSLFGWRSLVGYTFTYSNQPGSGINTVGNRDLKWETNYNTDIALEFGLFKQRLTGSVEYFNRASKDLLLDVPTATTTGYSSVLANIGELNNRGIEIDLGGDIIKNKDLRWGASVNATFLKTKVVKLYRSEGATTGNDIIWNDPTGGDARAQFIYREGSPIYSLYGFEWAGVHPTTGRNVWYVNDPTNDKAGDFEYNGRGATYTFGSANRIIIGDASPKVYGGFTTDLEYKNFTLALNFIYKIGGKIYDGAFKDVADDGYYWERIRAQETWDNMWTDNNKNGTLPKLSGNDLIDPMQYSTRQMHDASFVRLKNITLAYRLPLDIIQKVKLTNARVFINGTNLFTAAKYKTADPEVNQYGTRGWETPFGKTFTFGLELNF
ncbi:SusC/RagA family TonB-linked outer membrane protein [Terrimonas rubra]|uniref:SusC/RagA family TonB-linked outer membrane protein n=1 Tax=Terrimonas rubra TaxID=1035890 RepID=A0ABW6A3S6_9BACT